MLNDFEAQANGGVKDPSKHKIEWKPENIISAPYKVGNGHACLVLNREIRIPDHVVIGLWQNGMEGISASAQSNITLLLVNTLGYFYLDKTVLREVFVAIVRCCVDGGSNRWRQFLKLHKNLEYKLKPPDLITGDFDSITEETKLYFNTAATRQIHTPDQNATDFSKAVLVLKTILQEKHLQDIIVYHDTSGRFDQIMANINTLYKHGQHFLNIYLLSGNSLTWLLNPGKHSITIPSELVEQQRWCSLIPVGQEATNVTTKGLKWNLTNSCLCFGGLVSTSNTYALCLVEIETNSPLIWCMGLFSFSDD